MKLALVCSNGGHLVEMKQLLEAFEGHEYFYITLRGEDSIELDDAYIMKKDWGPMFFQQIYFAIKALRILPKEKPDVVITTGGGMATPFCYLAKLMGKKVVFIESLCRIDTMSKGGKWIYPVADLFLVQWEELKEKYGEKAKYWGSVF